jgi:aspartyl-tRNA(Asn)/glutamyl-tRNA(Gln) amidotransferase subunit A
MVGEVEKKVKSYLAKIKKEDKRINAFLELNKNVVEEARILDRKKGKKGKLFGYVFGVKSNINVKSLSASCASKTLEDYKSSFDATVIEKIKSEDGLIIGMCNCDEFASGWTGETSAFGATENPGVKGHVAGGSSSGSAAAVAAGFCDVSLGSDTGGSIRVPASFCGVVGVKPSYGSVSRYGLIDLSMSLDQIGPLAKSVEDARNVFDVIAGKNERDTKSFERKVGKKIGKKISVGVVANIKGVDGKIQELVDKKIKELENKLKWKSKWIDINHIDLAVQIYHPLCWTEFYSATRRFDGRKYGKKIEDSAGEEVLRRIFGGGEIAKAELAGRYYHKALQVRELIKREFERVFEKDGVDCIIMPTVSVLPWKFGKKASLEELYAVDALTVPSNLAEVCSLSLPIGEIDGKPVGMQIICGKGEEGKMFELAKVVERL